jgi:hypothetical protein
MRLIRLTSLPLSSGDRGGGSLLRAGGAFFWRHRGSRGFCPSDAFLCRHRGGGYFAAFAALFSEELNNIGRELLCSHITILPPKKKMPNTSLPS